MKSFRRLYNTLLVRSHISTLCSSSSSGNIFSTSLPGIKVQQRRFPIFVFSSSWWSEIFLSQENHILVKSWLEPEQMESVGSCTRNCLWLVRPFGQHVWFDFMLYNFPSCLIFIDITLEYFWNPWLRYPEGLLHWSFTTLSFRAGQLNKSNYPKGEGNKVKTKWGNFHPRGGGHLYLYHL